MMLFVITLLLVFFLIVMLIIFLIMLLPLTTKLTFSFVVFGNSSHDDGAHVTSHGNMFGNVAFIVIVIMAIDFFPNKLLLVMFMIVMLFMNVLLLVFFLML